LHYPAGIPQKVAAIGRRVEKNMTQFKAAQRLRIAWCAMFACLPDSA